MTKGELKTTLKSSLSKSAFVFLLTEKSKLSKGKDIIYDKLETQSYLKQESNLPVKQCKRYLRPDSVI